jgi:hypothetical protein
MADAPRVLVLTLRSDEQEFERSVASLRAQDYTEWDHRVFESLANREAHQALQREIMQRAGEYELFVKLDADMVFNRSSALGELVALFRETPDADHARCVVHDWFSDSMIMGLHVYSSRVRWGANDETLFVDTLPEFPGRQRSLWSAPAPFVDHCPDPSPRQAFFFGIHRALKAIQPDRGPSRFAYGLAAGQWRILRGTWRHFLRSRDPRLALAIMGADAVLRRSIEVDHVKEKQGAFQEHFDACAGLDADALERRLAPSWNAWSGAGLRYASRIGARALVAIPLELARARRRGGR